MNAAQLASSLGAFALLILVGTSLQGCGGGGGGGSSPTPAPPAPTPSGPHYDVDSPCVVDGDIKACVKYLNDQYYGYDETKADSPVGVTIRGQPRAGKWLWCGGACHNGQPDCYVAASVLNHKVMLRVDGADHYVAQTASYPVGIIFQPKAIAEWVTKCSWEFDGAAFGNTNGGCGNNPGTVDCKQPNAPYYDVCPETKKPVADDYSCPTVTRLDCTGPDGIVAYPKTCYWKGAAFYSNAAPNATLHPPNITTGDDAGIRKMLTQRLVNQLKVPATLPTRSPPTQKGGKTIPLLEYWNEITTDGKAMMGVLAKAPKAVVAAMMYQKGVKQHHDAAVELSELFEKEWGTKVPVVALDFNTKVGLGEDGPLDGPFFEPEHFEESETVLADVTV